MDDIQKRAKQVTILQELIGRLEVDNGSQQTTRMVVDAVRPSLRRVYSSAYMPLAEKCACLSIIASWPMTTTCSSCVADLASDCEEEVAALLRALWSSDREKFCAGCVSNCKGEERAFFFPPLSLSLSASSLSQHSIYVY